VSFILADMKLYVVLENVRSAYNVGSVFRTTQAAGVDKLFLTGYSPAPPHPKLNKTALGSIKKVAWERHEDPYKLVEDLKQQGLYIVVLETGKTLKSIFDFEFERDTALVFGNEVKGISKGLLALADEVLKIPNYGNRESLNVAVAAGIAIFDLARKRQK